MEFKLNGLPREYTGDPSLPLLTYLREIEGITSAKDGCAPQAACGCCAVQVDNKALLSCVTPMSKIEGTSVTTTEGLSEYRQEVFANAFVSKGGVQCGFCIPGMIMASYALIREKGEQTDAEIREGISGNLCRCTGYDRIVAATRAASRDEDGRRG